MVLPLPAFLGRWMKALPSIRNEPVHWTEKKDRKFRLPLRPSGFCSGRRRPSVRALPRLELTDDLSTETSGPRLRPHFTPEPRRWIRPLWRTPTLLQSRLAAQLTMKLPRPYPVWPVQRAEHGIPTDGLASSGLSDGFWAVS